MVTCQQMLQETGPNPDEIETLKTLVRLEYENSQQVRVGP